MRFIDDIRIFIVAPLIYSLQSLYEAAGAFLKHAYPPHFPLKPDSVNPCVGLELGFGGQLHWVAPAKGLTCGYDSPRNLRASFMSAQPLQQKYAIVLGTFSRRKHFSSSWHWIMVSLADIIFKFIYEAGYPISLVSK